MPKDVHIARSDLVAHGVSFEEISEFEAAIERATEAPLRAEIERLREALGHYAAEHLYFPRGIVIECQRKGVRLAPIYSDFGEIARAALAPPAPEDKQC